MRSDFSSDQHQTCESLNDAEQGQALVEYSMILLFVATVVVVALTNFGANLAAKFEAILASL